MHLRTRFISEVALRMSATLPEAMVSAWGDVHPTAAIEALSFKSTGGILQERDADWELVSNLTGYLRLELRADAIDALPVELLIANLVGDTVLLPFEMVGSGALTERARFTLAELRDTVRDTQVVSSMRFAVDGVIARRAEAVQRPEIMISRAPNVGVDHAQDYAALSSEGALK
ncbi:MAG: hypothetical protein AB7U46_11290 [Paenirhodobacter sp.]|uniref:hypothetical protein n=1 Tax=Paenirhodobacter sp. TaxID=1965326 RepID=UPI003D0F5CC7